jgi:triphosphoribosyl-dephospho-CoA synthase
MLSSVSRLDCSAEPIVAPIGRLAVRSLYAELALAPKPGLVSPLDSGSHRDMDAGTFLRSLFALRSYFGDVGAAGARGAAFPELQALGIAAERRMLSATGGVNTHRGAIFSLGLLTAAAGWLLNRGLPLTGTRLGETVSRLWGPAILAAMPSSAGADSHGTAVSRRYRVGGARREAVEGFPTLFGVGLPTLREALGRTGSQRLALVQTLFRLMARLDDTNLLFRGGKMGLRTVQTSAQGFLDAGGVYRPDWETRALAIHRELVAQNLSPGGSADLLTSSWFVYQVQHSRTWA